MSSQTRKNGKTMRARRTPKVTRTDSPTAAKARKPRGRTVPRTARTLDDFCAMARDNVTARGYWMLTDGYVVTITRQNLGEHPTAQISVPRHIFDAFADWYMTGAWKLPRKRASEDEAK